MSLAFTQRLLRDCQVGAGRHGPIPKLPYGYRRPRLPHYTIKIVTTRQVHLHESLGDRDHYVTLSHRWDVDGDEPLRTTTVNVNDHKANLPWEALKKTFRDAIALTHFLGMEYLWIDSLCILQDDLDSWSQQSKEMNSIYGNATLSTFATCLEACSSTV